MWYKSILEAFTQSDFNPDNSRNTFSSFAPARGENQCKYYICGEEFFAAVEDKLLEAKN